MQNKDRQKFRQAIERLTGPLPKEVSAQEMEKRLSALVNRPVRVGAAVLTLHSANGVYWVERSELT